MEHAHQITDKHIDNRPSPGRGGLPHLPREVAVRGLRFRSLRGPIAFARGEPSTESDMSGMKILGAACVAAAILAPAVGLSGCGEQGATPAAASSNEAPRSAPAPAKITDASRKKAKEYFATVCATCHGESGLGNGAGAAALDPKPRNFHDPAWQKSVTDEHIEQTIILGGAGVGKSPQMPAQPMLREAPAVVSSLREIIRGFGASPDGAPAK
jgi:mono/diheme cytochrome c family protein